MTTPSLLLCILKYVGCPQNLHIKVYIFNIITLSEFQTCYLYRKDIVCVSPDLKDGPTKKIGWMCYARKRCPNRSFRVELAGSPLEFVQEIQIEDGKFMENLIGKDGKIHNVLFIYVFIRNKHPYL